MLDNDELVLSTKKYGYLLLVSARWQRMSSLLRTNMIWFDLGIYFLVQMTYDWVWN